MWPYFLSPFELVLLWAPEDPGRLGVDVGGFGWFDDHSAPPSPFPPFVVVVRHLGCSFSSRTQTAISLGRAWRNCSSKISSTSSSATFSHLPRREKATCVTRNTSSCQAVGGIDDCRMKSEGNITDHSMQSLWKVQYLPWCLHKQKRRWISDGNHVLYSDSSPDGVVKLQCNVGTEPWSPTWSHSKNVHIISFYIGFIINSVKNFFRWQWASNRAGNNHSQLLDWELKYSLWWGLKVLTFNFVLQWGQGDSTNSCCLSLTHHDSPFHMMRTNLKYFIQ